MIGEQILKYRKLKGLSKTELGKISGVSHVQIGRYENGKVIVPTKKVLKKIANALEVPVEYLYSNEKYLIEDATLEKKFQKLKKSLVNNEDRFALSKVLDSFALLCK